MMHYCIAQNALANSELDRNSFILGNLAPDAHNGTSEGKIVSHFQIDDPSDDPNFFDIDRFIKAYMTDAKWDDFTLGYCCHLLSDNEWFKLIWTRYLHCDFRTMYAPFVQCDAEEASRRLRICYEDYSRLNGILIDHFGLSHEPLSVPKSVFMEGIHVELLSRLVASLYDGDFQSKGGELSLFELGPVLNYINSTTEKCIELICRYSTHT